jgi:hypothetical protein
MIELAIVVYATGKTDSLTAAADVALYALIAVRSLIRVQEQDDAEDDAILEGDVVA